MTIKTPMELVEDLEKVWTDVLDTKSASSLGMIDRWHESYAQDVYDAMFIAMQKGLMWIGQQAFEDHAAI